MAAYDGKITLRTDIDTSGLQSGLSKLGTVAKGAFAAATAAAVAFTKEVVTAYADFEQLTGGVETLFKGSADKVKAYANEAYKTAGMSANAYMENVTSFSASLLSSLGGDTDKAAEVANAAIISISDNANKMGTDMTSVTAAFQGFAKQQYQLLDNLKLGYGGTKTEMERLLKDAEDFSGVKYDINNLADVYTAIGVIQEKLDIAGTTAKEASTTISGAGNQMKAAWDNLLATVGNADGNVGRAIENFTSSVETFFYNLVPVVERTMNVLGDVIGAVAPGIVAKITELIIQSIPGLVKAIGAMVRGAIVGVFNGITSLLTGGSETQNKIEEIPENLTEGFDKTEESVNGIQEAVKQLQKSVLSFDELNILGTQEVDSYVPNTDYVVDVSSTLKDLVSNADEVTAAFDDAYGSMDMWIGTTLLSLPIVKKLIDFFKDKNSKLDTQTEKTLNDSAAAWGLAGAFGALLGFLPSLNWHFGDTNDELGEQGEVIGTGEEGSLVSSWDAYLEKVYDAFEAFGDAPEKIGEVNDGLVAEAEIVKNAGETIETKYTKALYDAIVSESWFASAYDVYLAPVFDGIIEKASIAAQEIRAAKEALDALSKTPIPLEDTVPSDIPLTADEWWAEEIVENTGHAGMPEIDASIFGFKGKGKTFFEGLGEVLGDIGSGTVDAIGQMWNAVVSIGNDVADDVKWVGENINWDRVKMLGDAINEAAKYISQFLANAAVPGLGVAVGSLPGFARGAVIPPNHPFVGVMGDQTYGNNIETPENLLRQIVREESGGFGKGIDVTVKFEGTESQLIKMLAPKIVTETRYRGKNVLTGGAI